MYQSLTNKAVDQLLWLASILIGRWEYSLRSGRSLKAVVHKLFFDKNLLRIVYWNKLRVDSSQADAGKTMILPPIRSTSIWFYEAPSSISAADALMLLLQNCGQSYSRSNIEAAQLILSGKVPLTWRQIHELIRDVCDQVAAQRRSTRAIINRGWDGHCKCMKVKLLNISYK